MSVLACLFEVYITLSANVSFSVHLCVSVCLPATAYLADGTVHT